MRSRRVKGNAKPGTDDQVVSLDLTDPKDDVIDLKLLEALERIERVRSKALNAVGSMIASAR
jgi:hypothetical protein